MCVPEFNRCHGLVFSPDIIKLRCDVCSRLPWFALQLGSKAQKRRQLKKADCFSVVLLVCGHVAKEYTKIKSKIK